jgi:hypothetical protein
MRERFFKVWCPELGQSAGDSKSVSAYDAEGAAKRWAARTDNESAEYAIAGGAKYIVHVSEDIDKPFVRFRLSAQHNVDYFARRLTD